MAGKYPMHFMDPKSLLQAYGLAPEAAEKWIDGCQFVEDEDDEFYLITQRLGAAVHTHSGYYGILQSVIELREGWIADWHFQETPDDYESAARKFGMNETFASAMSDPEWWWLVSSEPLWFWVDMRVQGSLCTFLE
jgi:hypothetical protein